MADDLYLTEESSLDLTLEGSVGSFKVGSGMLGQHSLEVKFFLTHVGLNFMSGSDEKLLSHLAPVREIFDFKELDFDEIMQRDIDDARVSSELIPYLLDDKSADLIKLFPPIVVVVLPVKPDANRPESKYPKTNTIEIPEEGNKPGKSILRSGDIGAEVFEFEQPIKRGKTRKHDLVRFRINTQRTKLVIVDGQHRAMALLALYRNIKNQWSDDRRAPFKEYYSEWTRAYIQQFNLNEINLPIIFCTVPELNSDYVGDFDLKKASRSIFLTLNKTARKVSNSRNILLDDNDIIAYFLRKMLSKIKSKDQRSPYSLRIWNVELDQFNDKQKIQSPVATTGVNHCYFMIEHLMLNSGDNNGITARSGKFYKRTNLNTFLCMHRLNGRDLLGAEVSENTFRDSFSENAAEILSSSFMTKYGNFIISMFEKFKPYEIYNRATLQLETNLDVHEDRKLKPIFFEGQGIGKIFETHRISLRQRLNDGEFKSDVPEIEEIAKRLDGTATRIDNSIKSLKLQISENYINSVSDKKYLKDSEKVHEKVSIWINDLFDNIFKTTAFQSAIICSFFGEIEKANTSLTKNNQQLLDTEKQFNEYIEQLNTFFIPTTSTKFKKLVKVFTGELEGEIGEWKLKPNLQTFRHIVFRGEMQPEQWPKYKYLILEIWQPTEETLKSAVAVELEKSRGQVFSSLYHSMKTKHCQEHSINEDDLSKDDLTLIFDNAFNDYRVFLSNIGSNHITKTDMKHCITPATQTDTSKENEEVWESAESSDSE
ncbi:hypothetical protein [Marinobacter sp.]|uniref:hypothetical protein n=1 Tax=Marinobacter sp. TaxID=50741 RepID=UPI003565D385